VSVWGAAPIGHTVPKYNMNSIGTQSVPLRWPSDWLAESARGHGHHRGRGALGNNEEMGTGTGAGLGPTQTGHPQQDAKHGMGHRRSWSGEGVTEPIAAISAGVAAGWPAVVCGVTCLAEAGSVVSRATERGPWVAATPARRGAGTACRASCRLTGRGPAGWCGSAAISLILPHAAALPPAVQAISPITDIA
jgi:hypothetical protein